MPRGNMPRQPSRSGRQEGARRVLHKRAQSTKATAPGRRARSGMGRPAKSPPKNQLRQRKMQLARLPTILWRRSVFARSLPDLTSFIPDLRALSLTAMHGNCW